VYLCCEGDVLKLAVPVVLALDHGAEVHLTHTARVTYGKKEARVTGLLWKDRDASDIGEVG
jgi:hypothetical protein